MAQGIPSGASGPGSTIRAVAQLSPDRILALHDAGAGLDGTERVLLALSIHQPGGEANVPLGIRDRILLDMYRVTFGSVIDAVATCSACALQMDVPLDAATLVVEAKPDASPQILVDDWSILVRPLDTADLIRAALCQDRTAAALTLAHAAIVSATCEGKAVAPDGLPPAIARAAEEAVMALDPMAETVVDVACPACGSVTPLGFDVGAFLWRAIDQAACGLLDDVATLARRYGWSERDVLAMSPHRRLHYLAAAE
ncbi:hypothetical protein Sa4125_22770 [Aureimonas sp. SA4125]|uniref:hypothetical protein n=1 Tax=Aureimonas sp. SA4125 TaxID=2826993 RepID=UPI001CC6C433|nr:hypothetical protein [Aureimonas sp. SA4125]BDA84735.1 hypothetical protein Sa4125_22770 [Aureimonas sp. SA4125]